MHLTNHKPNRIGLAPRSAFTLIELLVVITIISILAALIVTAAVGALKKAQEARIKAELNQVSSGFDEYKNKTTAYPPNCQTDGTGAANPINETQVFNDLKKHLQQIAPRCQEPDDLLRAIVGLTNNSSIQPLAGGMSAGEAIVFFLGGFSSDPKYPISGEGGPSYKIGSIGAATNRAEDPIESRTWVYPFDVSRLAERASDGYFDDGNDRFIEYTINGQNRRINFWQYKPAKSEQPYLYFDTSRYAALSRDTNNNLFMGNDPPAATAPSIALHVHAFKKAATSTNSNVPIEFVNPDKFQVIHCGIDDAWDEDVFEKMSAHGVQAAGGDPTMPDDYLLFPEGPFIGEAADTIVNFNTETRVEDSQPQ